MPNPLKKYLNRIKVYGFLQKTGTTGLDELGNPVVLSEKVMLDLSIKPNSTSPIYRALSQSSVVSGSEFKCIVNGVYSVDNQNIIIEQIKVYDLNKLSELQTLNGEVKLTIVLGDYLKLKQVKKAFGNTFIAKIEGLVQM
jgi:hypothetical protein